MGKLSSTLIVAGEKNKQTKTYKLTNMGESSSALEKTTGQFTGLSMAYNPSTLCSGQGMVPE